jgi:hypothetical protein
LSGARPSAAAAAGANSGVAAATSHLDIDIVAGGG